MSDYEYNHILWGMVGLMCPIKGGFIISIYLDYNYTISLTIEYKFNVNLRGLIIE